MNNSRKQEMNENNKKVLTQNEKVLFAMYVRIYWSVLIQNKLQLKELVVLKFCNQLTQFRFLSVISIEKLIVVILIDGHSKIRIKNGMRKTKNV
jgi:hypothetical protein